MTKGVCRECGKPQQNLSGHYASGACPAMQSRCRAAYDRAVKR